MANYLGYPFDPELFLYNWQNEKDLTLTAMFESGAVQANETIKNLIANGSNIYTIPFYKTIGGEPDNYDGKTDITVDVPEGDAQVGVVYGRAHGWKAQEFVKDFNSGADPMKQITSQVAKYWQKQRQAILIQILNGVFGVTGNADWALHTTNLATTGNAVNAENKLGATTVADAIQKAVGDASGEFGLAIMHSKVATALAGLDLLEFRKYTDANGIQRNLNIADINGMTVIVDDGVPTVNSTSASGQKEYTTYLFGTGAIQYAPAKVDTPVETARDAKTAGGHDELITRVRETLHPNGFKFVVPSGMTASPTNAQLGAVANWDIVANPKGIAMARIISNG
jgi:hypothetical protein